MIQNILGHNHVREAFGEAMQGKRLHHAWLLYGIKGIGKATLAQALRDLYLCASPDLANYRACGQCHHCAMLHSGAHPDYQHIELLWNNKTKKYNRDINIEQTRDALAFLAMSGLKSKRRVLLIDDANLMNNQAANALLKGLEEPTEGSLLLMVCHDLTRLPATIRSRCMLQSCAPLSLEDMTQVLSQQGMDKSLHSLAMALGQGSPGRVQALQEHTHAKALLAWQSLVENLAQSDVGKMQQWLDSHAKVIPHDLIVNMVVIAVQEHEAELASWSKSDAVFQATLAVAAWPKEVMRHSLRPIPALMSYLLQLRSALKIRV